VAFDLAQALRMKGMIDAVIANAPKDPFTATPALMDMYLNARAVCLGLVAGTDTEAEFVRLFPEFGPVYETELGGDPITDSARGDRADSFSLHSEVGSRHGRRRISCSSNS
jgi:hypothetical protein